MQGQHEFSAMNEMSVVAGNTGLSPKVNGATVVGVKCSEDVLTEVVRIAADDDDMLGSQ